MVRPFQFARLPQIHFGPGTIDKLPALCSAYGRELVLVTGKRSFMSSGHSEKLLDKLHQSGFRWRHIVVDGEPSPDLIDDAVRSLDNIQPDLIIGTGGGSVIDAGKAISAMTGVPGSVKDYLEVTGTKMHPGSKIPFIAVPTTSGTGSEATKNAVISRVGTDGFKRSLRHDNFVPDEAVVDPELTTGCPDEITAASGMDCFTQLAEAFLSDKSNQYTDALAVEGLKAVKGSLLMAFRNGQNAEARSGMSFAALTSGICLANAGLGVVHGFASSLGAMYSIPHGVICGTLMSSANEANVKALRRNGNKEALAKYATLGRLFLEKEEGSDDFFIDGFIEYLYGLSEQIKLPGLKSAGADEGDFNFIIKNTGCKNNPVKLSEEELLGILQKRYF